MATPVIMPRQGQSVETCIITEWVKKKGDSVKKGDILFTYETDKASFETEAEEDGILIDVFYNDGDEVPVLINVAVIGQPGEATDAFRAGGAPASADSSIQNSEIQSSALAVTATSTLNAESLNSKIKISPRARVMAEKMRVNLSGIKGSGPNGRIIARDIETSIPTTTNAAASAATSVAAPVAENPVVTAPAAASYVAPAASTLFNDNDFSLNKLSNMRKLIAKAMHESISNSAQLTHHMSADVRKLQAFRKKAKALADQGGPNITLNDMICFAVIRALEKFPEVNSHFLGDNTKIFKKVHLGLAVDTPRGLMVPSVQNADDLSLKGLSNRLKAIADDCKKGSVNPEILSSSAASFTVSNLGNYGVEMFTPIVNLPQVAILGVNTIVLRPADLGNGAFGFIPVIGLSLTYDHRAIDGGQATLFLKEIKNQIENFNETI
ncbi:MAG: dihydrolipoamide acetyltransferase family protein [Bacteroidota bacterium]|nr:dihydrolipoamide acetyltransferase family protein [Bacteroidota bacterium]